MMTNCTFHACELPARTRGHCAKHFTYSIRHGLPLGPYAPKPTFQERFWANVNQSRGCWDWTGGHSDTGYGSINRDGAKLSAHRLSYEMNVAPIPDGMVIDHICHNRGCVRPDHLRAVTQKQNIENQGGLRISNSSGYRGVYFNIVSRKWCVQVTHHRKRYSGGSYSDVHEAGRAAVELRNRLFTHNDLDRAEAV